MEICSIKLITTLHPIRITVAVKLEIRLKQFICASKRDEHILAFQSMIRLDRRILEMLCSSSNSSFGPVLARNFFKQLSQKVRLSMTFAQVCKEGALRKH